MSLSFLLHCSYPCTFTRSIYTSSQILFLHPVINFLHQHPISNSSLHWTIYQYPRVCVIFSIPSHSLFCDHPFLIALGHFPSPVWSPFPPWRVTIPFSEHKWPTKMPSMASFRFRGPILVLFCYNTSFISMIFLVNHHHLQTSAQWRFGSPTRLGVAASILCNAGLLSFIIVTGFPVPFNTISVFARRLHGNDFPQKNGVKFRNFNLIFLCYLQC